MDKSSKFLKRQIDNLKFAHQQMSKRWRLPRLSKYKKSPKTVYLGRLGNPKFHNFGRQIEGSATIFLPGIDITTNQSETYLPQWNYCYKVCPQERVLPPGKVVMIAHEDHEGKFVTLYGNLSNIQVTLDQYVRRGEKIARAGRSSQKYKSRRNPRLYYQVIVDLEPKNPIEWLERQQGT